MHAPLKTGKPLHNKNKSLKNSMIWHRRLGWLGLCALLLFALSGATHMVMSWTGPRAAAFFPPQAVMAPQHIAAIAPVLKRHGITAASMVRLVPSAPGLLLQVTEHENQPRRYFDLTRHDELPDYDAQHALWLARYYTGLQDTPVTQRVFQTEFDDAYPWVNRLLPVYRVEFATADRLTVFVYTELGAMANLTNDWKTSLQELFQLVHTWSWLDSVEHARVLLMLLLLIALGGMACTGLAMVILAKNRKMDKKRRLHRLAAYIIWLPLLLFMASGTYHLLQYAYGDNHRGLRLGALMQLPALAVDIVCPADWLEPYKHRPLNSISLITGPEQQLLYRLSLPAGVQGTNVHDHARFDGVKTEQPAIYLDAQQCAESPLTDRDMAIEVAGRHMGEPVPPVREVEMVHAFGPDYDFRNKRLPVWRVDFDTPEQDRLFVDPGNGMLVDRLSAAERYETVSFSYLHKWNGLTPLIGRTARDIVMALILVLALTSSAIGAILLWRLRK